MIRFIPAALLVGVQFLALSTPVLGQTTFFRFNIITNDATDFVVAVEVRTDATPNTLGSATVDFFFDDAALTFVDATGGVLNEHVSTWFGACLGATGNNISFCASNSPYAGSNVFTVTDEGPVYVRAKIIPGNIGPNATFNVDGYEVPSTFVTLYEYNFTKNPAAPGGSVLAKVTAPEDLTFNETSLAFGFFTSLDNSDETGVINNDCNEAQGGGCAVENSASLPVELTEFAAVVDNGDVILNWSTASETDNAGFSVEHAIGDAGTFEEIAFVDGAGTSLEARTYTHTVKGLDIGTHRFRLKQLDYDGSFELSSVVETAIELAGTHRLGAAYPNPFNPSTTFELVVGREQHVKIDVINALGQRVQRLFDGSMEANRPTNFTFQAGNLPTGLYFYRVVGETFAQTRQALLVK